MIIGLRRALASAVLLLMSATAAWAAPGPEVRTYKTVGDRALAAHVFKPDGKGEARPAVLLFHGGGWVAGRPEWTYAAAEILRGQGLVAIPIQYRLSGETATPLDALADACEAFAWVRGHAAELGVDPKRVAGYGVSAGGHLVAASGLGACPDGGKGADLMALWSPALDLARDGWFRKLIGGRDPAFISPLDLAARGGPATVVVQGAADTLTPLKGAEAFCAVLRGQGGICELNVYPGLGHLLTRNLAEQERNFDVDPEADRDGDAKINDFFRARGYIGGGAASGGRD